MRTNLPGTAARLRLMMMVVAAVLVMLPAASTLAQQNNNNKRDPNELVTPQPSPPSKTPATWSGTLIALGLAIVVLGVNCIPSKRGHQD